MLLFLIRALQALARAINRIIGNLPRRAVKLYFVNPNGDHMSDYGLKNDQIATIPLVAQDQNGAAIALPTPVSVSSSDESLLTAVLSADGASVVLTGVADGLVVVTATAGSLTATLNVTISDEVVVPVATTLIFDTANAVVTQKPAA